jgi:hypothetical protein
MHPHNIGNLDYLKRETTRLSKMNLPRTKPKVSDEINYQRRRARLDLQRDNNIQTLLNNANAEKKKIELSRNMPQEYKTYFLRTYYNPLMALLNESNEARQLKIRQRIFEKAQELANKKRLSPAEFKRAIDEIKKIKDYYEQATEFAKLGLFENVAKIFNEMIKSELKPFDKIRLMIEIGFKTSELGMTQYARDIYNAANKLHINSTGD